MTLDALLDDAARGTTTVPAGWGQGRATYGGLVAAMMLARAEALVGDPGRRLRSASVSFVGPVAPGEAAVEATLLRAGASASQAEARIVQGGEVRAVLLASFGAPRESAVALDTAARNPRPQLPAPETVDAVPFVPKFTPEFFQHVELRFAAGSPPFAGASEPDFGGWMRFRTAPARFGDRELIALADAWPPAILPLFTAPISASSIAWTYEPVHPPEGGEADDPAGHWQYDVKTTSAGGGYASTSARIWDARGRLRALSRQTVAFFG